MQHALLVGIRVFVHQGHIVAPQPKILQLFGRKDKPQACQQRLRVVLGEGGIQIGLHLLQHKGIFVHFALLRGNASILICE